MMSLVGLRTLRRCISQRSLSLRRKQPFWALKNDLTKRNALNIEYASRSLSSQPTELDVFRLLPPAKFAHLSGLADRGDIDNMIEMLREIAVEEDSKFSPLFTIFTVDHGWFWSKLMLMTFMSLSSLLFLIRRFLHIGISKLYDTRDSCKKYYMIHPPHVLDLWLIPFERHIKTWHPPLLRSAE